MEIYLANQTMGFLVEDTLHIGEVDDNLSNEFFLREFKGTESFKTMLETDHVRRRQQNGKNCIAVKSLLFNGKISEPSLARVLLLNEGIPVQVYDKDDLIHVTVPCYENGIATCDSSTCTKDHQSALDQALDTFAGGIIPLDKIMLVARWVTKVASLLVTQWLAKISVEHDIRLEFTRRNEVFLTGSLWVKSLDNKNQSAQKATQNDVTNSVFEDSNFKISTEPEDWIFEETLSGGLFEELEVDEIAVLREASILEVYCCHGRGSQIRWASQDVVKLDVRNEDSVLKPYHRLRPVGEELEEVFHDVNGYPWVKSLSVRRRYVLRPPPVLPLTCIQFGQRYG